MKKKTRICNEFNIEHPVIQAPMNWITGIDLASAVSNAGGLGTLGANAYRSLTTDVVETGEQLRVQIRRIKQITNKPFAVNFSARAGAYGAYSDQWIKVAIEEGIPVALLSGDAPELYTRRLHAAGIKVLYRPIPCTVKDAIRAEAEGVDALVAVGFESGGHSGRIATFVLIPQIVDAVKIPVVAGGGVVDSRGFVAALALGAEGVYIGTGFVATRECPAHPKFKQVVIDATDNSTVTWGNEADSTRALRNAFSERCLEAERKGISVAEIAEMQRSAYRQAVLDGEIVNGAVLMGAGAAMVKEIKSAQEVVRGMVDGVEKILSAFV